MELRYVKGNIQATFAFRKASWTTDGHDKLSTNIGNKSGDHKKNRIRNGTEFLYITTFKRKVDNKIPWRKVKTSSVIL